MLRRDAQAQVSLCNLPSQHDETVTIPLVLCPLRPGRLLLPAITVRPLYQPSDDYSASQQQGRLLPTCETNFENAATAIEVVRANIGRAEFVLGTQSMEEIRVF